MESAVSDDRWSVTPGELREVLRVMENMTWGRLTGGEVRDVFRMVSNEPPTTYTAREAVEKVTGERIPEPGDLRIVATLASEEATP